MKASKDVMNVIPGNARGHFVELIRQLLLQTDINKKRDQEIQIISIDSIMPTKFQQKMTEQPSAIYGMAFIGALIYFIQHAASFGEGALGFLKALVWPAIVIYRVLEFFKM